MKSISGFLSYPIEFTEFYDDKYSSLYMVDRIYDEILLSIMERDLLSIIVDYRVGLISSFDFLEFLHGPFYDKVCIVRCYQLFLDLNLTIDFLSGVEFIFS